MKRTRASLGILMWPHGRCGPRDLELITKISLQSGLHHRATDFRWCLRAVLDGNGREKIFSAQ